MQVATSNLENSPSSQQVVAAKQPVD